MNNKGTHSRLFRFGAATYDQAVSRDGVVGGQFCQIPLPVESIQSINLGGLHAVVLGVEGEC